MGDTFDIRYLQNFLVSNHAVTCSLPFLHLRFTLSRFVSLHILKEFIYYMYVARPLSLKFVRFSYSNNTFVIIVNIFCSLLFRFYVNYLFNNNQFRRFQYYNHKYLRKFWGIFCTLKIKFEKILSIFLCYKISKFIKI